jgi:uncharacterized membrane protein
VLTNEKTRISTMKNTVYTHMTKNAGKEEMANTRVIQMEADISLLLRGQKEMEIRVCCFFVWWRLMHITFLFILIYLFMLILQKMYKLEKERDAAVERAAELEKERERETVKVLQREKMKEKERERGIEKLKDMLLGW